jgi:hypothetical protein
MLRNRVIHGTVLDDSQFTTPLVSPVYGAGKLKIGEAEFGLRSIKSVELVHHTLGEAQVFVSYAVNSKGSQSVDRKFVGATKDGSEESRILREQIENLAIPFVEL